MIREYNRMKPINKIVYRITTIEDEERQQLVLPAAHIPTVLHALHVDMGHPGKDRTLSLLRDRFKKLLWVLMVLSDWLEFFVEDIFHIAQSRTLYLCTFLASKNT
jgi:hypothetical protein